MAKRSEAKRSEAKRSEAEGNMLGARLSGNNEITKARYIAITQSNNTEK